MLETLRACDPVGDRVAAHAVLRDANRRPGTGYTIHPGEWDWWMFHRDPALPAPLLSIGDHLLLDLEAHTSELSLFGASPAELVAVIDDLGARLTNVGWISVHVHERAAALASRGFAARGGPWPVFERDPRGGVEDLRPVPNGFTIRPLAGEHEAAARSVAARRAFRTDMPPERHVARYLAFMRSPAYEAARDIVAIDANGRVGAFAIHWVDTDLSLAQLEPVGTDPDCTRRGLARAVLAETFERIAAAGIACVRVTTGGDNDGAIAFYRSCGFEVVDHLHWWHRTDDAGRMAG